MRLRLCDCSDGGASVGVRDADTSIWIALADVAGGSLARGEVVDVVTFLALSPARREEWAARAASAAAASTPALSANVASGLAFEPRSFRDAALFKRHMTQAAKGMARVGLANGHALQLVLGQVIGKSLRLPYLLAASRKPAYYVGNPLTFVPDGAAARWPSHGAWLDYELEVALLLACEVSPNGDLAECERAILDHGAFVLINDFSARDTQLDELASVGFGFVKSKAFCTGLAPELVTADELWAPGDTGRLFTGAGLATSVTVNGERWGASSTSEPRVCSLAEYVKFAALDEGLYPGELLGLGTVPDCCGLEVGKWLAPGDVITVACEALGSLTNVIANPLPRAVNYRQYGELQTGEPDFKRRLKAALKLVVMAVIVPPLSCVLLLTGAFAALFWSGPETSPGKARRPTDSEF